MFLLGFFFFSLFYKKARKGEKRERAAGEDNIRTSHEEDGPRIKLKVELLFTDWENKQECLERRGLGRTVHKAGVQTLD